VAATIARLKAADTELDDLFRRWEDLEELRERPV